MGCKLARRETECFSRGAVIPQGLCKPDHWVYHFDIGIGAGRSTQFLLPLARSYTGVDYSPEMIAAASKRFPSACDEVRDARNLSNFADASFDLVMFSVNGIDCLSHHGRMQAMSEIKQVKNRKTIALFQVITRTGRQHQPSYYRIYAFQNIYYRLPKTYICLNLVSLIGTAQDI